MHWKHGGFEAFIEQERIEYKLISILLTVADCHTQVNRAKYSVDNEPFLGSIRTSITLTLPLPSITDGPPKT